MRKILLFLFLSLQPFLFQVRVQAQVPSPARAQVPAPSPAQASGSVRQGVVAVSVCCLRQAPDYESPLESQELMGRTVDILADSSYWRQVHVSQPYTAWTTDHVIVEMTPAEMDAYRTAPKYIYTAQIGKVFSAPSGTSDPLCDVVMGGLLRRDASRKARCGFAPVLLPDGRKGWVSAKEIRDEAQWKREARADGERLVATARQFLGIPYLWGGMSPKGFDCSGLVRICYLMNGQELPRNASQMVLLGEEVPVVTASSSAATSAPSASASSGCLSDGRRIDSSALRKGDLLFFGRRTSDGGERITHVGMYIGGGRFIHASHLVRINAIDPAAPDAYENMYKFLCARRILTAEPVRAVAD